MIKDTYESPLSARYASKEMKYIFFFFLNFNTLRSLFLAIFESAR